jgi:DNA (cytosine-5)-methyltransferase 1
MSDANAIKLSERAAAILQGFPEDWHFAGKTKASRWSQIGMAMPPGLAEPVARSIVNWFAKLQENAA